MQSKDDVLSGELCTFWTLAYEFWCILVHSVVNETWADLADDYAGREVGKLGNAECQSLVEGATDEG